MAESPLTPVQKLLRVEVDRTPSTQWLNLYSHEEIDRIWDQMCFENPKYFNGPILSFTSFHPDTGVILARVEQYKHHAVYNSDHSDSHRDLNVSLFAVTACIQHADGDVPRFLIGRRSMNSHCYGGLWEFGPSGGVQPPEDRDTIATHELIHSLMLEIHEEIGIDINPTDCHPRSVVYDSHVGSVDLHFDVELQYKPELNLNWEYDDTRWVTLDELLAWCDKKPDEIIPTTIAHARFLHEARG